MRLVSFWTALRTHVIAEGKGRRVALLLARYDRDLSTRFEMEGRFGTRQLHYPSAEHDLYSQP